MLLTILTMVCGNSFAQEATTVLWESSSGDALTTIYPDGNISLKWEEGGGDFAPKYSNGSVYFYNGNRLTVAGTSTDVTITKIVFTFSSGSVSMVTCNASGKNESSVGITNSSANMTSTWEGETNSLIFRASQRTGVRNISSIEVTYTGGSTGPVVTAPELAITQANIADTYDMDANGVFVVYYENKGTAAAENVKLTLYVDGTENASNTIGTLAIGASNFWNAKYDVTSIEAGEHQVYLALTADNAEAVQTEAKTVTFTKKAPEATFSIAASNVTVPYDATSFTVVALLTNTSEIAGADVKVELRDGITTVAASQTVETLAASASTEVRLTVEGGPFDAGQKTYYLYVNGTYLAPVNVTFEAAPVEDIYDLAITEILGTIELANTTNNVRVTVQNNGNVDINDAVVTLKAGETMLGTATVSATKNGGTGFCTISVASEGLEAGELNVTATVTVDGDATPDDNTMTATLTVKEVPAPEATFVVTAANVEVLTTDATVKVVVNVKNNSEVKADQVEVKLLRGTQQKGESKYIFGLEGGTDQNVTIEFDNYESAGTYEMQAWAGKQASYFNVVVKEPEVDLAIEAIQGIIDLSAAQSNVSVTVKNVGTADVTDAPVMLNAGETLLGTATVSVKAGETGYAYIQVPTAGLQAGELDVIAIVAADGDTNSTNNTKTATLTVKAAAEAEATFSVTAEDITVPFGAESFDIVATVKNTSEVDAQGLTVKLLKGITEVETKTLNVLLAAGAETTVTFTVNEIGEAGTTAIYYVQAGNAQKDVTVTFAEEAVTEVKDLAIESIQGTIDLSASQSNVTVTVKNNGNVEVKNAKVTLSYGETVLEKTVSAKAGEQGYAYFQVASEGITGETLAVTATVELEGDATPDDNTKTENLTVKAAPAAEPTFSLTADNVTVTPGQDATAIVKVKNTSTVNATGVEVKILYSIMTVATKTVDIAAGETKDVEFTVTAAQLNQVLALLGGKTSVELQAQAGTSNCFFTVTVQDEVTPVVDMALTQIQGVTEINLKEENQVLVWYKNEGNVTTTATISATLNGTQLEAQTVENVKAEGQNYVTFTLPVEGLTAGETATFVATIAAEGDTNADNNEVSKELAIVSGEAAPVAEIAINPISGFDVEAGEQTVNIGVTVFNNGEVEAKDVKVELYKSYGDGLCEAQTVDVPAGENNFKMLTFTFTYTFEAGKSYEFTAYTGYADANTENNMQKFTLTCPAPVADVAVAKIADIEATTEEDVVIAATLTNNSSIEAKDVKVGVYTIENLQYQLVGFLQNIETIAAGESAEVTFNLGKLEAGNYTYYVQVTSVNGKATSTMRDVTVKVTEPVVETVEVELTQLNLTNGHIDLAETNTVTVWVANNGNVDAVATINVTLNGTALEAQTVSVKVGKNGNASFVLNTDGLVAGEKATVVATVTVEGNTSEKITETKEYDIVDSSVATEPVFEIAAQDVEIEFGAEKFNMVATVKNVSEIAAENVEVNLFYNEVIATKTVEAIAANGEAVVTFEDVANPFTKAGEYTLYVQAPKATGEVKVTVKAEPVEEVIDLSVIAIQGELSLDNETNTVTVFVENLGNVDVENAALSVSYLVDGDATAQADQISVMAGKSAWKTFEIPSAELTAGEFTIMARVDVFNDNNESVDANEENNSFTQVFTVKEAAVAEPAFSITAEDVTVPFGAGRFEITATVKNISNVTANGLTVTLKKGITEVETKALNIVLAAGEETEVTFTIEATEDAPFVAGTTATYYVQVLNVQTEVTVTFEEAPVEQKVDLAVTAISGTLNVDNETNNLIVWVANLGTVDVNNAVVTLTNGEKVLGTGTVSAKAGSENNRCTIAVAATDLTVGTFEVTATVAAENDVDETNNSYSHTYTIAAPAPVLSFTVADVTTVKDAASFDVKVTVKNSGKGAASNVAVKVYDENSAELGTATIATLAAGAEETVTITINKTYTQAGFFKNQLQVYVSGVEGVKWVGITVENTATTIQAIKAKYGENVEIYTLTGRKVNDVRRRNVYIINGKKVVIK